MECCGRRDDGKEEHLSLNFSDSRLYLRLLCKYLTIIFMQMGPYIEGGVVAADGMDSLPIL